MGHSSSNFIVGSIIMFRFLVASFTFALASGAPTAEAEADPQFLGGSYGGVPVAPPSNCVTAVINGKLYVFGGYSDSGRLDLVEVYSPASNSWASAATVPSVLECAVAVAL